MTSTLALEIHDVDLLAARSDDDALISGGPGYAFLDGDQIRIGEEAAARARLLPKRLNDRFWRDLGGEALGRPWSRDLTRADLAHAHLRQLCEALPKKEPCILAVPGSFSDQQLGFLLGIAQALDLSVEGLVDLAVAAATEAPGRRLLHLDLHLHALVATELKREGNEVNRRRVEVFDGIGLQALHDVWARRTAELFIRATRFDPLHSAASEQALYLELTAWSRALSEAEELEVSLDLNGKEYLLDLERHEWFDAAEKIYRAFDDAVRFSQKRGENLTVLLAPSLAELPGVDAFLSRRSGVQILPLARGAAARGALRAAAEIRQPGFEALTFVTALPSEVEGEQLTVEASQDPKPSTPEPQPTHLLYGGVAWPIDDGVKIFEPLIASSNGSGAAIKSLLEPCCVVREAGTIWFADGSSSWRVNHELVVGRRALKVGDRLTHPSDRSLDLQWIRVESPEDEDGATSS